MVRASDGILQPATLQGPPDAEDTIVRGQLLLKGITKQANALNRYLYKYLDDDFESHIRDAKRIHYMAFELVMWLETMKAELDKDGNSAEAL